MAQTEGTVELAELAVDAVPVGEVVLVVVAAPLGGVRVAVAVLVEVAVLVVVAVLVAVVAVLVAAVDADSDSTG